MTERQIDKFLSESNSISVKGLAAICVMFGHYFESFPWYVGGWVPFLDFDIIQRYGMLLNCSVYI